MLNQIKKTSVSKWEILSFLWIGIILAPQNVMGGLDMFNPGASAPSPNGSWGAYGGAGGVYAANGGGAGGPNLGNEVSPATVARYFKGLELLKNVRALPANPSSLSPAKQAELLNLYNTLGEMENAQNDILAFFGRTYTNLGRTLDRLAYLVGTQRIPPAVNPVVRAFGITGGDQGGAPVINPTDARKMLLQLAVTTNKSLYNADQNKLERYQNTLSEIIASDVPPVGVNIDDVKIQFLRVQRALGKDGVLLQYPDIYTIPANATSVTTSNAQKIQVIVNRWIIGQANLLKLVSANVLAGDRQNLVAAKLLPEIPPLLKDQMEVAIAQMDAMQLRLLNAEIEKIDFDQQLATFKKAVILKNQNPRSVQSKTMDVNWLSERIESYTDLIDKINSRLQIEGVDRDLMQGLKIVVKRSQENLTKLEKYKDLFAGLVNAPVKRVNLNLQTDVERVYSSVSQLVTSANILRDSKISSYESTLKQALASPQNMPDTINIIQVRELLKVLQKARGIVFYQQLKPYEKKVNDLLVESVNLGETAVGKLLAPKDSDFVDVTDKEKAEAQAALQTAATEAGKALGEAKKSTAPDPEVVKAAEAKLKKAQAALKASKDADEKRAAYAKANAVDKAKSTAQSKVFAKKMEGLVGVKDIMDQLVQSIMIGAFGENSATFGGVDVSVEQAMALVKKVNDGLVSLNYKDAVDLSNNITNEAKNAQSRLTEQAAKIKDGQKVSPKSVSADLKWIKLSLIYGIAGSDQSARKNVMAQINAAVLTQLMNEEFRNVSEEKIQNPSTALSTLDRLEQLVVVEDAQGPGREKARDLMDRITKSLEEARK